MHADALLVNGDVSTPGFSSFPERSVDRLWSENAAGGTTLGLLVWVEVEELGRVVGVDVGVLMIHLNPFQQIFLVARIDG